MIPPAFLWEFRFSAFTPLLDRIPILLAIHVILDPCSFLLADMKLNADSAMIPQPRRCVADGGSRRLFAIPDYKLGIYQEIIKGRVYESGCRRCCGAALASLSIKPSTPLDETAELRARSW